MRAPAVARYSSGFSEYTYAQTLAKHSREQCDTPFGGGELPRFIIDSGRSGNAAARTAEQCHDWCNLRSAGAGAAPTVDTPLPDLVDALFWVKVSGLRARPTEAHTLTR
jgi:cellulase/cellobiase CelA1